MLRLMVQGDRDATGIEDAVRELGRICKEREIGLNVGEAGQIVRILAETGAHVRVHQAQIEATNLPEGFTGEILDCYNAGVTARNDLQRHEGFSPNIRYTCWGIRLAALAASDGFIFFPGREGTLAHLVPTMAFIAKGERDKDVARPRRVALMGWNNMTVDALSILFDLENNVDPEEANDWHRWIRCFETNEMTVAINWLTEGLTAK